MAGLLALVAAPACGNDDTGSGDRIDVFAAASLTAALTDIAKEYERSNAGVAVRFNFAGSSTLATQIRNGAEADVFVSADETNMRKVVDGGQVADEPRIVAHNQLAILVPSGNPKKITQLQDLTRPDVTVAACAPEVPAGRYAREAFTKAGIAFPKTSQELDVKQVVNRVRLGEADAGIAYASDAVGESKIAAVAIPAEHNVLARYPAVSLTEAGKPFVDFLLTEAGQQRLRQYGFVSPT